MEDPAVISAFIAAAVSLLVAGLAAYFAVWTSHRQRSLDLIAAAFSHMTGGIQQRGAGLAALAALGASTRHRKGWFVRSGWEGYATAVGQHLYRQLIYVLNYGDRDKVHEVENLLVMLTLLTEDAQMLGSCSTEQKERLRLSLEDWTSSTKADSTASPLSKAIAEAKEQTPRWVRALS